MHRSCLEESNITFDLLNDGQPIELGLPDADICLFPGIDLPQEQAVLMHELVEATPWRQDPITLWGKTYLQPRLTAWYGDPGTGYSYSGLQLEPLPWSPRLQELRKSVQTLTGERFNSVLLNYYRDHRDSMGMHADDEPELGPEPAIASLSLGETRTLKLKHRTRSDLAAFKLSLPGGSLLLMRGSTQRCWKHGIDKLRRPCGARLNLTFRRIMAVD